AGPLHLAGVDDHRGPSPGDRRGAQRPAAARERGGRRARARRGRCHRPALRRAAHPGRARRGQLRAPRGRRGGLLSRPERGRARRRARHPRGDCEIADALRPAGAASGAAGERSHPMSVDHERYAAWDAAYALGALSTLERAEFEEHLAGCSRCRAALAELTPTVSLLSRVSAEDAQRIVDQDAGDAVPVRVLAAARARQGARRRIVAWAIGAAAAVVVATAVIVSTL